MAEDSESLSSALDMGKFLFEINRVCYSLVVILSDTNWEASTLNRKIIRIKEKAS
jgi:hypothetical protein